MALLLFAVVCCSSCGFIWSPRDFVPLTATRPDSFGTLRGYQAERLAREAALWAARKAAAEERERLARLERERLAREVAQRAWAEAAAAKKAAKALALRASQRRALGRGRADLFRRRRAGGSGMSDVLAFDPKACNGRARVAVCPQHPSTSAMP